MANMKATMQRTRNYVYGLEKKNLKQLSEILDMLNKVEIQTHNVKSAKQFIKGDMKEQLLKEYLGGRL